MTYPSDAAGGVAMNASDSTYYYNFPSSAVISLTNGPDASVQITAGKKVVFIMNNKAPNDAIALGGTRYLAINAGSSLTIYTDGNLVMSGGGVLNSNDQPSNLQIYGTALASGSQTITLNGNGALKAAVYAPNAAVTANGGGVSGGMQGAIIAKTIVMHGGEDFHYDEALGKLNAGAGVGVLNWRELQSATERAEFPVF